ncbi:c-type cytochrome [Arhodomonas aquaeolei]|uniref:c-type cytochrome n=1 Tax=Arhodomonas aquaeolei TaxID=2369 RepID=UPI00035DB476|nr:cytochrome c [Arhodomonas aquaeolei]
MLIRNSAFLRRLRRTAFPLLLIAVTVPALSAAGTPADAERPAALRGRSLGSIVREDCGACHGLRLTGGLGPDITASALSGRDVGALAATIEHGRPGTAMPPFGPLFSPAEIRAIARGLKSGRYLQENDR